MDPAGALRPVKADQLLYSGQASSVTGDDGTLSAQIKVVSNDPLKPIRITTEVKYPNLSNGDKVVIDAVKGVKNANGTFKIDNVNVTNNTFDLFENNAKEPPVPVAVITIYEVGGLSCYPNHPYVNTVELKKVFYRVKGDEPDGTFLGTFVSVKLMNGKDVDRNKKGEKFRVWGLGPTTDNKNKEIGRLLLSDDLTDCVGRPLEAGVYDFTFFELPVTDTVPCGP